MGRQVRSTAARAWCLTLLGVLAILLLPTLSAVTARAQETSETDPLRMTVEPTFGRVAREGGWAAVRVRLENDGPAVDGELRVGAFEEDASRSVVEVQLPTGARQELEVISRVSVAGSRLVVSLVSDAGTLASTTLQTRTHDQKRLGIVIVAERPRPLTQAVGRLLALRPGTLAEVTEVLPEDLPRRAQAWAAADRIVWQDIAVARLEATRQAALVDWVASGGELLVVAGTMGMAAIEAIPAALLPFQPDLVADAPASAFEDLLGGTPLDVPSLPALTGVDAGGRVLAATADRTVIARRSFGRGGVTLVGIDLAAPDLAGSAAGDALWSRLLPLPAERVVTDGSRPDRGIVDALGVLPAVEVPQGEHLLLLFGAYVLLLGPVNYLVLRRLDRREWAWITMPLLIAAFTVIAFGMGVALRGSSVVIKELAIVRGTPGLATGTADVFAGVFAPDGGTFDVQVPGDALVSSPRIGGRRDESMAIDVIQGDPALVRGLQVGYGDVRSFRAEATVAVPTLETDLRQQGDRLVGTIRNASDVVLEDVAVVHGSRIAIVSDLVPGGERVVDIGPNANDGRDTIVQRLLGDEPPTDAAAARTAASRGAILRHLLQGRGSSLEALHGGRLVVLAWRPDTVSGIDAGVPAERVGDTLYVLPVTLGAQGPVRFVPETTSQSIVSVAAPRGQMEDAGVMELGRGTMTVEIRPTAFEGTLEASALHLRFGPRRGAMGTTFRPLLVLPPWRQPDQADPVGTEPTLDPRAEPIPRLQLRDRAAGRWVEVAALTAGTTYTVTDPRRYVDDEGVLQVRFVNRSRSGTQSFAFAVAIEGTAR